MLNEKATHLKVERERLRIEFRQLNEALLPLDHYFEAEAFRQRLLDFNRVRQGAAPEEVQRLLRLAVRKIEWMPEGGHSVEYYFQPGNRNPAWFKTNERTDTPDDRSFKPLILRLFHWPSNELNLSLTVLRSGLSLVPTR